MNDYLQKFFKYVSLYMAASVDAVTAFKMARKRIRHKGLGSRIDEIVTLLSKGNSVSEACIMLKNKKYLDSVAWSMLASADKSGSLKESCDHISRYLQASGKIRKSFVSALAYPAGVIFMAFSMVYFLISFIFPKIVPLFASLHAAVPPATEFLMFFSDILKNYSMYMFSTVGIAGAVAVYLYKTKPKFKLTIQALLFRIPFIKRIIFAKESHRISLSCSVLMQSGKNTTESLVVANVSSNNLVIRKFFDDAIKNMEAGRAFSDFLAGNLRYKHDTKTEAVILNMFDGEWVDFVAVGEMTGTLPQAFSDATCFESRLREDLELIARWSEPAALAVSASVILVVAMSVIQPMYSILQYVHS